MSKESDTGLWQFESELGVIVHKKSEKFPATLIDITTSGISLISEKSLMPGTEVEITMDHNDDFTIHGTIKLMEAVNKENSFYYRLGIEVNQVLASEGTFEGLLY